MLAYTRDDDENSGGRRAVRVCVCVIQATPKKGGGGDYVLRCYDPLILFIV